MMVCVSIDADWTSGTEGACSYLRKFKNADDESTHCVKAITVGHWWVRLSTQGDFRDIASQACALPCLRI